MKELNPDVLVLCAFPITAFEVLNQMKEINWFPSAVLNSPFVVRNLGRGYFRPKNIVLSIF